MKKTMFAIIGIANLVACVAALLVGNVEGAILALCAAIFMDNNWNHLDILEKINRP